MIRSTAFASLAVLAILAAAPPADTGREAWLLGGGDNAEVVYDRRR